ncbi:hypothetical protein R1sor_017240 [Riccia sorocarpa]|uniref:U-box domain-containing protein n=1 Tax=Riccia sorocarpa TaxID=122646 RepID=A0ABD3I6N0_9MARC
MSHLDGTSIVETTSYAIHSHINLGARLSWKNELFVPSHSACLHTGSPIRFDREQRSSVYVLERHVVVRYFNGVLECRKLVRRGLSAPTSDVCLLAMLSHGKHHGRLPRAPLILKAQTFGCGIFGVCSPFLLSPRTATFGEPHKNAADFSASNVLLIQDRRKDRLRDGSCCADTPDYSLNIITSSAPSPASRSVQCSQLLLELPLSGKSWAEVDRTERHQQRKEQSPQRTVEDYLVRIRRGQCSKASMDNLLKLVNERNSGKVEIDVACALVGLLVSSDVDDSFRHTECYQEAFVALARLVHNEVVLQMCAETEMLKVLDWILNKGSLDAGVNAALMLQKIACKKDLEVAVRSRQSFFDGVVRLMVKREQPMATNFGTKTLLALCLVKENRAAAVRAGAVAAIVRILPGSKVPIAEKALAVLELLATTPEGRTAMSEHELLVQVVVNTILRLSDRAAEYAAGALCAICTPENPRMQELAVQAGAQTRLLLLIQSQCTPRAKRKALLLLKTLHKYWQQGPRKEESGLTGQIHY